MIKYISYITLILFICLPAVHANVRAQNSTSMWQKIASLFYTDDHEDTDALPLDISKTADELNHNHNDEQNRAPSIQGAYYLSSIIYSNNKKWSIWLNDQIINPTQMHQL